MAVQSKGVNGRTNRVTSCLARVNIGGRGANFGVHSIQALLDDLSTSTTPAGVNGGHCRLREYQRIQIDGL
jgi:hypothetical protein